MTHREKELEKQITIRDHKIDVQNRLIESLLEYVKTISPTEPEEMIHRRKAARTLVHGENL